MFASKVAWRKHFELIIYGSRPIIYIAGHFNVERSTNVLDEFIFSGLQFGCKVNSDSL